MNWRPDGWPKLGEHPCGGKGCLECRDSANKEAGADALMEALFKLAKASPTGTFTIDSRNQSIYKGGTE